VQIFLAMLDTQI